MFRRGGKTSLGVRAPLDLKPSDCRSLTSPEMRSLEDFSSRMRSDVVPAIRRTLEELQRARVWPPNPLHYLKVKLGFRPAPEDMVKRVQEEIRLEEEKRARLLAEIVDLRDRLMKLEIEMLARRANFKPEEKPSRSRRKGSPAFQAKWDKFFEPMKH